MNLENPDHNLDISDDPLTEGIPRGKDGNLNPDVLRGLAEMFRRTQPNGGADNDNKPPLSKK